MIDKLNICFANIFQGFVYEGQESGRHLFSKYSPPLYADYFKSKKPDILCLAEVLIDDKRSASEMVSSFSKCVCLPYYETCVTDKSWVYDGKYYGMAILTKYPIQDYKTFRLPNPNITKVQADGSKWITHDKYVQQVDIEVSGKTVRVYNLHYLPLHRFNKTIIDRDVNHIRLALLDILGKDSSPYSIITGDFNTKGISIEQAFPELFEKLEYKNALDVETTMVDKKAQYDYVLYKGFSPDKFVAEKFYSDHFSLCGELGLTSSG